MTHFESFQSDTKYTTATLFGFFCFYYVVSAKKKKKKQADVESSETHLASPVLMGTKAEAQRETERC